ncbi:hypothetical protein ACFQL7_04030 [Halocatena marina]|uniref:Uncharacterized protein n=2 Tax=Halocatena marina TaxID=2934937 RepID=A0ABD5YJQ5_9EURY
MRLHTMETPPRKNKRAVDPRSVRIDRRNSTTPIRMLCRTHRVSAMGRTFLERPNRLGSTG